MIRLLRTACLALICLAALPATAQAFRAAVLYNVGGKLDKSFNESAFRGVLAARAAKLTVDEYEPATDDDRAPMLESAAQSADIVVAIGFAYRDALSEAAKKHPAIHFTIVDNIVDLPNVQSVRFKEQEGAFLAGVAAAESSSTRIVGFVGGMDSALVRRFQAGFEQGVRHAVPGARVVPRMLGTSVDAFADPMAGYLVAKEEIADGADVLFAAAGASGLGVYQAAEEAAAKAIGVDSDQNYLFPGTMLTSVVKHVGDTVLRVVKAAAANQWRGGMLYIGLKEGGLSLAIGRHNAQMISPELREKIDRAATEIAAGTLVVEEMPRTRAPIAGGGL